MKDDYSSLASLVVGGSWVGIAYLLVWLGVLEIPWYVIWAPFLPFWFFLHELHQ